MDVTHERMSVALSPYRPGHRGKWWRNAGDSNPIREAIPNKNG